MNPDGRSHCNKIKEFTYLVIPHTDTPLRGRASHRDIFGSPMNIDIALHRVHGTPAVLPRFTATQPEDTAKNPVPPRMCTGECWRPDFPGGTAPHEHSTQRTRCTILGGGDQIGSQDVFVFAQVEGLRCELNRDASF